jgi:hypothetical protein
MSTPHVVVAAPGMTTDEVVRNSTARLRVPPHVAGLRVAQALQVHRFVVPHPEHTVSLEPGLMGLLMLRDGVVESVRASPHTAYLQRAACVATLDACAATLDAAGWRREGTFSGEQALVRAVYGGAAVAGVWIAAAWRGRLMLRRVHAADSAAGRLLELHDDAFVVTLQVGPRS